jgi:hypothetical protein
MRAALAAAWTPMVLVLSAAMAPAQTARVAPTAPTTPAAVAAGAPALSPDNPVQCWWRAGAGAVRLGELLDVVLTCAVLETDAVTAVADESRLTVAAVQLNPFEIVDGSHPPDVRHGDRRFFQYRYRLRIINPDVIGRDVKLPPLAIPYKVQSRMGAATTLAGRDLVHLMPQLVFRVASQVPADADDIRDSTDASLAEIQALRFRANAFSVAAMVLTVLGVIAALSTLMPAAGLVRRRRVAASNRLSDRVVLSHAAQVLGTRLDAARSAGWTPEHLAEAHAAARLVAALASGVGARERPLASGAVVPEGRLAVRRRFGRQAAALTTHATTDHVIQALSALPAGASAMERSRLERLRDALAALTRAQYGAAEHTDAAAVDDAVTAARDISAEMAREKLTSPREWFGRPVAPVTPTPEF